MLFIMSHLKKIFALSMFFIILQGFFQVSFAANESELSICSNATFTIGGKKYWKKSSFYLETVEEAKRKGFSCGVNPSCVDNTKFCHNFFLCKKATTFSKGSKVWAKGENLRFVNEAKFRRLDCGAKVNPFYKPFSDSELCSIATITIGGKTAWKTKLRYEDEVEGAKRRGLSCNVNTPEEELRFCEEATVVVQGKREWRTSSVKSYSSMAQTKGVSCGVGLYVCNADNINFRIKCPNATICSLATKRKAFAPKVFSVWKTNDNEKEYKIYVDEAKRRDLSCGVPSCFGLPYNCSNKELCHLATGKLSGKTLWSNQIRPDRDRFVTEAKNRKIDCGVNSKSNKMNIVDSRVCSEATKIQSNAYGDQQIVWGKSGDEKPYVEEAKIRGLKCDVGPHMACADYPRICSEFGLCHFATEDARNEGKGLTWTKKEEFKFHVEVAKLMGYSCGIKNCSKRPEDCTGSELCKRATSFNFFKLKREWITKGKNLKYSLEAKERGMTCDVKIKTCEVEPKLCNGEQLCKKATVNDSIDNKKKWNNTSVLSKYVKEAKKRGLTCGIEPPKPTKNLSCANQPTKCSVDELCDNATSVENGKIVWTKNSTKQKHVKEAIKKGVSCFVEESTESKSKKVPEKKTYEVASGTGFFVSEKGHIVTNAHVLNGCEKVKAFNKGSSGSVKILNVDAVNDLALLRSSIVPEYIFPVSKENPPNLQQVIVAGFPFGTEISSSIKFTQGIVSSQSGIGNDSSKMQIDAAMQPGNSGGPITDKFGNVIGVAVAKLDFKKVIKAFDDIPENTNFGIKASTLLTFLEGNDITALRPNRKTMDTVSLGKKIEEGTIYLSCEMTKQQIEKLKTKKVMFKQFDN